jgi:hypothetical protein
MVLDGKKIEYTINDISSNEEAKTKMREFAGPKSLPPQICNGDQYCGVSTDFSLLLFKYLICRDKPAL